MNKEEVIGLTGWAQAHIIYGLVFSTYANLLLLSFYPLLPLLLPFYCSVRYLFAPFGNNPTTNKGLVVTSFLPEKTDYLFHDVWVT